jgi:hypothetical protein
LLRAPGRRPGSASKAFIAQVVDGLETGLAGHARHTASRTSVNSMAVVFWQPTSASPTSVYDNVSTCMLACNAIAAEKPSL